MAEQVTSIDILLGDLHDSIDALPPVERIVAATAAASNLHAFLANDVAEARRQGATWQEIADALGVTRSAAWQRFSGADHTHDVDGPHRCEGCNGVPNT